MFWNTQKLEKLLQKALDTRSHVLIAKLMASLIWELDENSEKAIASYQKSSKTSSPTGLLYIINC